MPLPLICRFFKSESRQQPLLRQDTVDLGKVYVGLEALRPVYWVNAGSLPLLVFSAVATSPELVSKPAYGRWQAGLFNGQPELYRHQGGGPCTGAN